MRKSDKEKMLEVIQEVVSNAYNQGYENGLNYGRSKGEQYSVPKKVMRELLFWVMAGMGDSRNLPKKTLVEYLPLILADFNFNRDNTPALFGDREGGKFIAEILHIKPYIKDEIR